MEHKQQRNNDDGGYSLFLENDTFNPRPSKGVLWRTTSASAALCMLLRWTKACFLLLNSKSLRAERGPNGAKSSVKDCSVVAGDKLETCNRGLGPAMCL